MLFKSVMELVCEQPQLFKVQTSWVDTLWNTVKLKGIVHPERKIRSLSTQHYAYGGVGEVFESTEHFSQLG